MLAPRIVVAMCCAIRMSVLREFDGMDIAAVIEADPCRKGARNFVHEFKIAGACSHREDVHHPVSIVALPSAGVFSTVEAAAGNQTGHKQQEPT
jgi:hypothetical protein